MLNMSLLKPLCSTVLGGLQNSIFVFLGVCAEDLALVVGSLPGELVIDLGGIPRLLDALGFCVPHGPVIDEGPWPDSRHLGTDVPLPSLYSGVDVDHAKGTSLPDRGLGAPELS